MGGCVCPRRRFRDVVHDVLSKGSRFVRVADRSSPEGGASSAEFPLTHWHVGFVVKFLSGTLKRLPAFGRRFQSGLQIELNATKSCRNNDTLSNRKSRLFFVWKYVRRVTLCQGNFSVLLPTAWIGFVIFYGNRGPSGGGLPRNQLA